MSNCTSLPAPYHGSRDFSFHGHSVLSFASSSARSAAHSSSANLLAISLLSMTALSIASVLMRDPVSLSHSSRAAVSAFSRISARDSADVARHSADVARHRADPMALFNSSHSASSWEMRVFCLTTSSASASSKLRGESTQLQERDVPEKATSKSEGRIPGAGTFARIIFTVTGGNNNRALRPKEIAEIASREKLSDLDIQTLQKRIDSTLGIIKGRGGDGWLRWGKDHSNKWVFWQGDGKEQGVTNVE